MIKNILKYLNLKNLIKLSVCVITLVSIIIVTSRPSWFFKDLPEENFVKLNLTKSFVENCEICERLGVDPGSVISRSTASGMAIYSEDDKTYILTADHFCNGLDDFMSFSSLTTSEFTSDDHYGNSWESEVVFSDPENDLCLLVSKMPEIETVTIADEQPEVGETVFAIAAPKGYSSEGVSLHFEGQYSGCDNTGDCAFVMQAYFGSSGGAIMNYRGEVISVIQRADMELKYITLGPNVSTIRYFLERASNQLGVDLLQ